MFHLNLLVLLEIMLSTSFGAFQLKFDAAPKVHVRNICAGHSMGEFVANPYDCSKFFYCLENGEGAEADCPHGMLFNRESKLCDQEASVRCEVAPNNATNSGEIAAVERYCDTQALQQNGRVEYVSSASSCRHYYICYYGQSIRQECSANLHWNANTKRCDFATSAGCRLAGNGNTQHGNGAGQLINCPAFGQHVFPHMRRCDFFVYCVKGHAILQQCPFYFEFDVDSKTCKLRNVARCVTDLLTSV